MKELYTHLFTDKELAEDSVELQATSDDIFLTMVNVMTDYENATTVSIRPADAVILGTLLIRYGTDAL